jgi:hypothetical protein
MWPKHLYPLGWWEFADIIALRRSMSQELDSRERSRGAVFHLRPDCDRIEDVGLLRRSDGEGWVSLCAGCCKELYIARERYEKYERDRLYRSSARGQPGSGKRR